MQDEIQNQCGTENIVILVTIGGSDCEDVIISGKRLTCNPPKKTPRRKSGDCPMEILVNICKFLTM